MPTEGLEDLVEGVKDELRWQKPESVGTSRVRTVVHSSGEHDMVFIDCGGKDVTKNESVFTPRDQLHKGDIVEVIIQRKRGARRPFLFPPCRVAVRRLAAETYGKVTEEDRKALEWMLQYPDNGKNAFFNRAFYRKFFTGARKAPTPFPDIDS